MAWDPLAPLELYLQRFCKRSRLFTTKNWQYGCLLSGMLSFMLAFLNLVAADFLPPLSPTRDAEFVHNFYHSNKAGMHATVPMLLISGGLYIPYSALISRQLRRIPNLDPMIPDLQFGAAVAGIACSFMTPALFCGMTVFRDYSPELTLLISDQLWLSLFEPWTTFWVQGWAIAWAIFSDDSPNPIFPKIAGLVNFAVPFAYFSFVGIHIVYSGPYAWNGALTFWFPAVAFGLQVGMDCYYMFWNIWNMADEPVSPSSTSTIGSEQKEASVAEA
ncbi:uncharacterized protein LTR77_008294 [Saxophila tyrrhenica]|uniref:Uncharacterized protein n=1 Tax=Saxophila tyrrhenica TaxID=1690608 RepID=A0AAV9P4N5_9PEZI|nr:hypothetical protein LTR77_008294 [Saxophila tyrrhenica]